jgi:Na+/H+-translocating membrane pyrophosphatase
MTPQPIADNVGDNVGDVAGMSAIVRLLRVAYTILATVVLGRELVRRRFQGLSRFCCMVIYRHGYCSLAIGILLVRVGRGGNRETAASVTCPVAVSVASFLHHHWILPLGPH